MLRRFNACVLQIEVNFSAVLFSKYVYIILLLAIIKSCVSYVYDFGWKTSCIEASWEISGLGENEDVK